MTLSLSSALLDRLRSHQRQTEALEQTAIRLLTAGLSLQEARQRGAAIANSRMTPEQRTARARHAVAVREAKRARSP